MEIRNIESTPNPEARKFVFSQPFPSAFQKHYSGPEEGKSNPLAQALFSLTGVQTVFLTHEFVTVGKSTDLDWGPLQKDVVANLAALGEAVQAPESTSAAVPKPGSVQGNDELYHRVMAVIDEKIKPALEGDGGGLEVVNFEGTVLTIRYQGACGGCPSAARGTLMAIQNLLRAAVDPRVEVVSA